MAIKKKLTKRQLLDELLIVEEKKVKYEESLARVYSRGEKIEDCRKDLVDQLETICVKEQEKDGVRWPEKCIPEPILYKKHVFASIRNTYGNGWRVSIKPIKVVK